MYDFHGQHKAATNISLGGATRKVDKSTLLQSARAERLKREQCRKENMAVLLIQSWYHGCSARKDLARRYSQEFDVKLKAYQQDPDKSVLLEELVRAIGLFYKPSQHYQRLVALCQILLKLSSSKKLSSVMSLDMQGWIHRMKKLLVLCCRSLHSSSDINVTIPLRMLEVFTNSKTYYWLDDSHATKISLLITIYLVLKGYFQDLYRLINVRIPSSLEPSSRPPVPFAEAAKDLVVKPLNLVSKTGGDVVLADKSKAVYTIFIKDMLSPPMSEQVCYFLIPAISPSISLSSLLYAIKASDRRDDTVWTLYSLLTIFDAPHDTFPTEDILLFVHCLRLLVTTLIRKKEAQMRNPSSGEAYDSDSDDSMEIDEGTIKVVESPCMVYARERCFEIINSKYTVSIIQSWLQQRGSCSQKELRSYVRDLCEISYNLLSTIKIPVHKSRLLTTLAFNQQFIRLVWEELMTLSTKSISGKCVLLIHQLSLGYPLTPDDHCAVVPLLGCFVVLFRYTLFSIYDADFYHEKAGSSESMMPFSLREIINMSQTLINIILGLISLIYPDAKLHHEDRKDGDGEWHYLCQMVTQLVKQLYSRDSRHKFCPEQHWLSSRAAINIENINVSEYLNDEQTQVDIEMTKPGMSTMNARNLAILKYIPFAVPFLDRVQIFQKILSEDKNVYQSTEQRVMTAAGLNITVNRKYLYQDAYDQLSKDRAHDVKKVVRVQMVNSQGLEEAGIDGGGVFREFMSQLIKSGFDPSYGFFKTTSQQLLYPNPDIVVVQEDYMKHLHFLGRMLGKIIYESMMVELPLAEFFLCKLLNRHGSDVDIYHLESLDPELYKNLLYLKNYEGDADDLALNFTVMNNDYGETKLEELKAGGHDICVTNGNKIEYIHMVADYRLNKQIRSHVNAFRAGLSDVINIEWLQMFDHRELQILISGAPIPIDMEELRMHTNYSGAYTADDAYITQFWQLLSTLTDKQKRQFLKFVTSCSRPPLLGFEQLYPKFCIHYGGEEDRLPTASTCMNFLKLPRYSSVELLTTRLIYAIEAEAGFELS